MIDLQPGEVLTRAYIEDALKWAKNEHLVDLAKAHAAAQRQPRRAAVVRTGVVDFLRGLARRLVPLRT